MPSSSERTDVPFGDVAGHETDAEVAEHPLDVEHGRAVDLRERVTQRREVTATVTGLGLLAAIAAAGAALLWTARFP